MYQLTRMQKMALVGFEFRSQELNRQIQESISTFRADHQAILHDIERELGLEPDSLTGQIPKYVIDLEGGAVVPNPQYENRPQTDEPGEE